jgi:hypothetical protein
MNDDLHTDGNGTAGALSRLLAVDTTTMLRTCASCGTTEPVAAHRAYHGAGIVLRCPGCETVAIRLVEDGERVMVEWRGTFTLTG